MADLSGHVRLATGAGQYRLLEGPTDRRLFFENVGFNLTQVTVDGSSIDLPGGNKIYVEGKRLELSGHGKGNVIVYYRFIES